MTQNERVLAYIREHGEISPAVTLHWSPPITRLAARIADLKAAGHPVDQIGSDGKFARYGFVDPRKPDAPPMPKLPKCPACMSNLWDVRDTLSPELVSGKCPTHGKVTVKR